MIDGIDDKVEDSLPDDDDVEIPTSNEVLHMPPMRAYNRLVQEDQKKIDQEI